MGVLTLDDEREVEKISDNERVREWKAAEAVVDRRREEVILGRVFPGLC